jgi:hypothetical protein
LAAVELFWIQDLISGGRKLIEIEELRVLRVAAPDHMHVPLGLHPVVAPRQTHN